MSINADEKSKEMVYTGVSSMSTHLNARKTITYVTGSLLIIGGLNWLVTALNKNRKDIFDYVLPGDKNAKLRSGV